jgi:hypothetical protein
MVSFTPLPLYPRGKKPRYPLDRRVGGPQRRSRRRGEKSSPYLDSNPDSLVVQPVESRYTDYTLGGMHNKSLVGKPEGKGHLKVLRLRGRITLKWIVKKKMRHGLVRLVATATGVKPSGFVWPLLDHLSEC